MGNEANNRTHTIARLRRNNFPQWADYPFTNEEIRKRIASINTDTFADIDGIKKKTLQNQQRENLLRKLCNLLLITWKQPSDWKNRTTLMLKEGKDPLKAERYRPLTIGSLIGRLFGGGIID
jgi:hypothetical protein